MKNKLPRIKITSNKRTLTATLLAFFPNPQGGKNGAFVITENTTDIPRDSLIREDQTGKFLLVNELAIPISVRLDLHKQSRQMGNKPLVYDERVKSIQLVS